MREVASVPEEVFLAVTQDLEMLHQLTEDKIQAVVSRNPDRLLTLLQDEIDPMTRLMAHTVELPELPADDRDVLRRRLTHWAEREAYLAELLEQHLGYVDFMRTLLRAPTRPSLDLGL